MSVATSDERGVPSGAAVSATTWSPARVTPVKVYAFPLPSPQPQPKDGVPVAAGVVFQPLCHGIECSYGWKCWRM